MSNMTAKYIIINRPPIYFPDIILPPVELSNLPLNINLNEPILQRSEENDSHSISRGNQGTSQNLNRRLLNRNLSSNNLMSLRSHRERLIPINQGINIRKEMHIRQANPIRQELNTRQNIPIRPEVNISQGTPIRQVARQTRIIPARPINLEYIKPIRPLENSRPSGPITSRRPNPHRHIRQISMIQIPQIMPIEQPLNLNQNNINNNNQFDINNKLEDVGVTEQILNKSKTKTCVICQQDYNIMEKICYLPCFHFYHSQCIRQWVQTSNICPICKNEINFD